MNVEDDRPIGQLRQREGVRERRERRGSTAEPPKPASAYGALTGRGA
jgi:hypothetical protein